MAKLSFRRVNTRPLDPSARKGRTTTHVKMIGDRKIFAEGLESSFWTDLYHNAMTVRWPIFFLLLAAAFFALNLAFACIFALGEKPIANANGFFDYFFFSVQTTATLGYGELRPQTIYANIIATVESFIGMVLIAVMTGLVFSRFSRPRARMIFARYPVVSNHDGAPTLILRIANARNNFISEANAKLWALIRRQNAEGKIFIGFEPLTLIKSENPIFALSWTLFHRIDESSPLSGVDIATLPDSEMDLVLSVSGLDETSAQFVHARKVFPAHDIRIGHEYVDIHRIDENGIRHVDYAKFDETRPVDARD